MYTVFKGASAVRNNLSRPLTNRKEKNMVIEEEHVFIHKFLLYLFYLIKVEKVNTCYRIKWAASPHKQEKKRNKKEKEKSKAIDYGSSILVILLSCYLVIFLLSTFALPLR